MRKVPVENILEFLSEFRNHEGSMLTAGSPVAKYIRDRVQDELSEWDVLFASLKKGEVTDLLGLPIHCQTRSAGSRSDSVTLRVGNKQRVASRGVEKTGLTTEQVDLAEREYRRENPQGSLPDRIYREKRERPLLILHLLKVNSEPGGPAHPDPVVAWSISFPRTQKEEQRVEYVVNTTWLRENFREESEDEDLEDE